MSCTEDRRAVERKTALHAEYKDLKRCCSSRSEYLFQSFLKLICFCTFFIFAFLEISFCYICNSLTVCFFAVISLNKQEIFCSRDPQDPRGPGSKDWNQVHLNHFHHSPCVFNIFYFLFGAEKTFTSRTAQSHVHQPPTPPLQIHGLVQSEREVERHTQVMS